MATEIYKYAMKKVFKKVLILGAGSAIVQAMSLELAKLGAERFEIIARNDLSINNFKSTLNQAGFNPNIVSHIADSSITDEIINVIPYCSQDIDLLITAPGLLVDQNTQNPQTLITSVAVNFTSPAIFINEFIRLRVENPQYKNKALSIGIISSVAGDRPRASNYWYGSSKAALSGFGEAFDCFCHQKNLKIQITVIKPGLVATPMIDKREDRRMVAQPNQVAKAAIKDLRLGKKTVYYPGYWKYIMWVVKKIPYVIFRKIHQ